jgi:uncharacterized protein (DUF1778 family)
MEREVREMMRSSKPTRPRRRQKGARLAARVSFEQKALFKKAAAIEGRTLTEFLVGSAQEKAQAIVQAQTFMKLTARDSEILVNALLNPPAPNKRLLAEAERFKKTGL